jgi:hypothetical protein
VAALSNTWVCGRSLAGIVGSNSAGVWMSVCCKCCVLSEVSVSGWSLVHRNRTECGVSECDRESSIMRSPWTNGGCCSKVNQSRNRPGVAQSVSRKLSFPDFTTTAQDGGKVVNLTHRKYTWYSFLLEAESTPGP